jgi:membrane protein
MQTTLSNKGEPGSKLLAFFKKELRPVQDFITKLNNDWAMSSASALAYNLIVAIVPIAVALLSGLGFTVGRLNPDVQAQLVIRLEEILPFSSFTESLLQPALISLSRNAGFLSVIAIFASIFGGSRLFVSIEGYFDIIYRVRTRKVIAQNVMAISMMLVFLVLIPVMVFASSVPALLAALFENAAINYLPAVVFLAQSGFLLSALSILASLMASWILLETIYMVVPNQKISFKQSWPGAAVAAILLQVFLLLFPLYITHFMGSYQGTAGFVIILLVFFYYFAVILFLGAEINAYFVKKIPPLPDNIAAVLCEAVGEPEQEASKNEDTHELRLEDRSSEKNGMSTELADEPGKAPGVSSEQTNNNVSEKRETRSSIEPGSIIPER